MFRQKQKCSALTVRVLIAALIVLASGTVARAAYWNVFNIEGESSVSAAIVTYATLPDMLADTNRLGVSEPNPFGFGVNIVGSGAEIRQQVPIPEPAPLAILLTGVLMLALVRYRRDGSSVSEHGRDLHRCIAS